MKVKIIADFPEILAADINVDTDKKVEFVLDYAIPQYLTPAPKDTIRIFATLQPEGEFNEMILNKQDCFDFLFTTDGELLRIPKARFVQGFYKWVDINENIEKRFSVSSVFSARRGLPGHVLRRELWNRRDEIRIPKEFYLSSLHILREDYVNNLVLGRGKTDKNVAMNSMFHIAIDSVNKYNFFSEKLLDPLITKTIPIYWGCSNLSEFFNMDGIIKVDSVDDIINATDFLTEEYYYSKMDAINENFTTAVGYSDWNKAIEVEIKKCLKL